LASGIWRPNGRTAQKGKQYRLGNIIGAPLESWSGPHSNVNSESPKALRFLDIAANAKCASPVMENARSADSCKHRIEEFELNYLCAGYKMFFKHIDPYMEFIVGNCRMAALRQM
jgi:hypothetical protein